MNAETVQASAPGRVNLIGEHTDYNEGWVLPVALPLQTHAVLTPAAGRTAHVASAAFPGERESYTVGAEQPGRGWLDYVQGVTWALAQAGHTVRGFDVRLDSEVPVGSGLSSSAALEVALLRALRTAFALRLDDVAIARLGQAAENGFVGAQTGIMDQMAASLAPPRQALLIDCRSLATRAVAVPSGAALLVLDSGLRHSNADGGYNRRRAECAEACRLLAIDSLRDLSMEDLDRIAALPAPLNRRARHVVTENARVLQAAEVLAHGDLVRLGALMAASHASQRDDYEVSLPAIDRLVAAAAAQPGVYGARLTGGGWGGCVVALTNPTQATATAAQIVSLTGAPAWWVV